jgi:glycosyltransferase involved in cell wall biosynthesis
VLKWAAFRRGVAFIGGFAHAPNIDAADWLVREVMPLVWQHVPDMPCYLVGSAMPEAVRCLAGPLVHALGHVESLQMVFNQVRLTVAPLRFGAGLKGKVLDSLAAGVPCVCTPVAAEGITALEPDAVETPEALASRIAMVHEDLALQDAMAEAGRTVAATHYGEAAVDARMAEVVAPVLQRWNLRYGRRRTNGTAARQV